MYVRAVFAGKPISVSTLDLLKILQLHAKSGVTFQTIWHMGSWQMLQSHDARQQQIYRNMNFKMLQNFPMHEQEPYCLHIHIYTMNHVAILALTGP